MPKKCVDNDSAYHSYQIGDLVVMTNLFNAAAGNAGKPDPSAGVSACIEVPLANCANIPQTFPDFSGCYRDCDISGDIILSYAGQIGNTSAGVRGFPAAFIGSAGGRNETWGVPCHDGTTPVLYNKDNGSGTRGVRGWRDFFNDRSDQRSHVFDLLPARRATGYPAKAGSLPQTRILIDAADCGAAGTINGFVDTYWHDVSGSANTPVDSNGNRIVELVNTINGISGRCTRMWNLNFWWQHPDASSENSTTAWTGGRILNIRNDNPQRRGNNIVRIDGRDHRLAIKWESGGDNNFFYLGFVFLNSDWRPQINYNAYADYVKSAGFWADIQADAYAQDIIATMASPGSPRGQLASRAGNAAKAVRVRRPDNQFVVDSIQVGTEIWGTRDTGSTGATCFRELAFEVDGKLIGRGNQRKLVCRTVQCKTVVTELA